MNGAPLSFGEQLRDLRRARNLSLRAFATASHYSKSLLGNLETGRSVPAAETAQRLDTILGAGGRLIAAAHAANAAPVPAELALETVRTYARQGPVVDEIRRRATAAVQLDVLAVRGLGLLGLNDSLLQPSMTARSAPLQLRVLLLDPDCPAAAYRAREIAEPAAVFIAGIKLTLARLAELAAAEPGLTVEVRLYDRLPIWRIIRLDQTQWVATFAAGWEGHESTIYEVAETPRGALWAGYRRTYEDLTEHSRRII